MVKIVRKLASTLAAREDRDSGRSRQGLLAGALEAERTHLENLGRAWRLR